MEPAGLPESVRAALAETLLERTREYEDFLRHPFLVRVRAFCRAREAEMVAAIRINEDISAEAHLMDVYNKINARIMGEIHDGQLWSRAFHAAAAAETERVRGEHDYLDRARAAADSAANAAAGASGLLGEAGGAARRAGDPWNL